MTQSLIVAPVDLVLKGENENKPDYAMLIGVVSRAAQFWEQAPLFNLPECSLPLGVFHEEQAEWRRPIKQWRPYCCTWA